MARTARVTFEVKSWDEKPYDELEHGPGLTRAAVAKEFHGDLEATSAVVYLMMHRPDGTAHFTGFERVTGALWGRAGTFVVHHQGTFAQGTAATDWFVVPGSGTGELDTLGGSGHFAVSHAEQYSVSFDFELGE